VLETALEEDRAPTLAVVAPKLKVVALPSHAGHDVADPPPVVKAAVQEPKLRLMWLEGEEAEGGAERCAAIKIRVAQSAST
jgi:hypothetical protein